ncbi:MAG: energy transducer TonB [Bacteroidetes bacterium]|nr:MAG: energy transducer TonB [Bacteroidota bacterium]
MEIVQEKNKRTALIATILFHLLLFILFAIFGLSYIEPKPEQGIVLNFGTTNEGSGEIQPTTNEPQPKQPQPEQPAESTPPPVEETKEEIVTQENEETINLKKQQEELEKQKRLEEERKRKEEELQRQREEEERKRKEEEFKNKLSNLWDKTKQNTGGEGTTNQQGDQGKPEGTKDGNAYSGTPGSGGNGISFSLSGRSLVSVPKIVDTSQDEGKVVVDIIVDRNGNVIQAIPGGKGTTTTSAHLFKKAKEAALKTKFSPNPDAPEKQYGQMTFIFVLE